MQIGTVTTLDHSQSVQLPEGFQFDASEVYVKRMGRSVLLIPKDANAWEAFENCLDMVTNDFMSDRAQLPEQVRGVIFE